MEKRTGRTLLIAVLCVILLMTVLAACQDDPGSDGPKYVENGTTVKLEYNDGVSRPHSVIVAEGGSMAEPAVPVRQGYSFTGWSTSQSGGSKVSFPYKPSGDSTLYAGWEAYKCNIVFNMNFEGGENVTEKIEYGKTVTAPETPERKNMSFYYWAVGSEDGPQAEFPYTAKSDVTFVAVWAAGDLTVVSFDLGYEGAETRESIIVADGESITRRQVEDPARPNYKFQGWSETPDGSLIRFPYTPDGSVTLYAVWQREVYTVAFRTEYTDAKTIVYSSARVEGGESVNAPEADPVREGYTFDGWYTSSAGGERIVFPLAPTANTAVYAHWKHVPVVTDIFEAEYTVVNPNETYPGYSGEARGVGIFNQVTNETGVNVDRNHPLNSKVTQYYGYYATYLYKPGATLEFVIESSAATTATLKANMAVEFQPVWTFQPTGESAYQVIVNGVPLNYGSIAFTGNPADASTSYKSPFREFDLGTINLKEGTNVIQLVTNNSNTAFGGTMKAVAPMTDYIKLENHGNAVLSWSPVYDNLG